VSLGSRVEAQQQNTKITKQRRFESSSSKVRTQKRNRSITKQGTQNISKQKSMVKAKELEKVLTPITLP
jgi:hypothetical protein